MPSLTIKNIPDEIYLSLKDSARRNRRSLNREAIVLLEGSLKPRRSDIDETIASLQRLHARLAGLPPLDDVFLETAKNQGRP
jgi:plasmid stability protein